VDAVGALQLSQIKHRLEVDLVPHIDASDLTGHQQEGSAKNVLSRALAAFVVQHNWDWDPESAAACVTDGTKDGGLDAIAVDPSVPKIMLVQSKWSSAGTGSAAKDDMLTFREGIDRLIKGDWGFFSEQIQARRAEVEEVLFNAAVKIELCFVHSGSGALADEVESVMTPLASDLNELEEVARFQYFGQANLHSMLASSTGEPITINVELSDWGMVDGPVQAFYGHVSAQEVASWHSTYGDSLFATNLRSTLPNTGVNDGIAHTIRSRPQYFWYFNNGVTVLCTKIAKAPAGGTDRRLGHFTFTGAQVVNGAQTVGSIAGALAAAENAAGDGAAEVQSNVPGRVMVRFIELEGTEEGFGAEVTRWTNTQNRVGGREFLALDPEQVRLANEFALDGRRYVYRSGEEEPVGDYGCGVQEATVALACLEPDIRLTVLAKREVSRLWADVEKAPYKTIFNGSTNSIRVWRAVQTMRIVDQRLEAAQAVAVGRSKNFLVHLNRVALWLVNRSLNAKASIDDPNTDWAPMLEAAAQKADQVTGLLPVEADKAYPGYPANLAKNAAECEKIGNAVLAQL
jgi:hypothetical protein